MMFDTRWFATVPCLAAALLAQPVQEGEKQSAGPQGGGPQDGGNDVVLRALTDEMARSVARLEIDGAQAPYFLEYIVVETTSATVAAAFGAVTTSLEGRHRTLHVGARVGDYKLDNTNFASGDADHFDFDGGPGFPIEDDYDAMRHALWLATDSEYHAAVETLEKKKAYLEQKNVKDRPDDFARAVPVVAIGPLGKLQVDRARWAEVARRLSAGFRDHPAVQSGDVHLVGEVHNQWLANSEGFRNRKSTARFGVLMSASAQAADGMHVSDSVVIAAASEAGLPKEEILRAEVAALCQRVAQLAAAAPADDYRGPVLFEGLAAAQLFAQVLAPNLANPQEVVGEGMGLGGGHALKDKLGKRILPKSFSVVDDPGLRDFHGQPVLGWFTHDDDGVPAQKVTLVEEGTLKTFCSSRVPSRHVKESNGHCVDGEAGVSTLIVQSNATAPLAELRQKLAEAGRAEDLEHVLVVRKLGGGMTDRASMMMMMAMMMRGGGSETQLAPPVLAYLVSLEDGSERLLRGASFGDVSLRVLRDIEAAGDDSKAHRVAVGFQDMRTIIAPSVLVKELSVQKAPEETDKLPVLPHPFFAR